MTSFTPELMEQAKACASAEELAALAKENNIELTAEEAKCHFDRLHAQAGELADEELEDVAGGGCHMSDGRMIVSYSGRCDQWTCPDCGSSQRDQNYFLNLGAQMHSCGGNRYNCRCQTCKYVTHERSLWLCSNPSNMKK